MRRLVAQGARGGDVHDHGGHLARLRRNVLHRDVTPGDLPRRVDHVVHRHRLAGAQDQRPAVPGPPRREQPGHDVVHVDQVPDLGTVAVHLYPGAVTRGPHQPRNEAVLLLHARAVNIGEPQRAPGHAVAGRVRADQHLGGRLGGPVRGERPERDPLIDGGAADVAGHRVRGGEQERRDAADPRLLQQRRRGLHVHPVGGRRVLDRLQYPRHRGQVDDDVSPGAYGLGHDGRIAQVPDDGVHVAAGRWPLVGHRDVGAVVEQRAHDPPADEAGPAGHKHPGRTDRPHGGSVRVSRHVPPCC